MTDHYSIRFQINEHGHVVDWHIVAPKFKIDRAIDRPVHGGYPTPPKPIRFAVNGIEMPDWIFFNEPERNDGDIFRETSVLFDSKNLKFNSGDKVRRIDKTTDQTPLTVHKIWAGYRCLTFNVVERPNEKFNYDAFEKIPEIWAGYRLEPKRDASGDVRSITTHCDECNINGLTHSMIANCQRTKCPAKPELNIYSSLIDEQPSAEIVTLYKNNFRDPVHALRTIADEIERGEYGEVGCVALALMGDKVECFGAGSDSDGSSVAMLFHAAFLRMSKAIEEHGE